MAYLITGGTGLVGSRIAKNLAQSGQEVIAYEFNPDYNMLNMVLNDEEKVRVKVVPGDVLDYNLLLNTLKENQVDTIIHYAAILGDTIKEKPLWATKINVEGTLNVFEAARVLKLKKVVWASSNAIFPTIFPNKLPVEFRPDDYIYYPWGLYGAAKLFGENAGEYYFRTYGMDITAVRYGPILFGAGQQRGKSGEIIKELILNPAIGKPGKIPWGDATMLWLYVDDAARAGILSCEIKRNDSRGAYNIGGHRHSVSELFDYVKELLPDADMELIAGDYAGPCYDFDTSYTEQEIKFFPEYSIKQGIKETINMMRKQYNLPMI